MLSKKTYMERKSGGLYRYLVTEYRFLGLLLYRVTREL